MTQTARKTPSAPSAEAGPGPASRWANLARTWAPALIPALLMLVVGRLRLRQPGLGWDENASWLVSQRTVGQILDQARHFDGVISPYYLFLHFWTGVFGDSEFAMRAPSLLAVAAGVGVAGELGRRLFGPVVGLTGALMLVLVPQLSRYAQDARAYGPAFLFAGIATLLFYRAVERPSWGRWIAYAALVTLTGLAHIMALLMLAGHAYVVGSRWWLGRDKGLRRWLVATAVALVPVLPLICLGSTQRGEQLDWIAPMDLDQVAGAPGAIFGSAAGGLLLIGLALAVRWTDRQVVRELAVLAAVPPVVLIAVSFVTSSLWVPRYVLFVVPAVALLAAAALHGMRLRAVLALALLAAVVVPAQRSVRGPASHMGADLRAVARIIEREQRPGDAIVYARSGNWSLRAGIDYQLRDRTRPRDALLATPAAEVGQLAAVQCPDEVACLGGAPRVFYLKQWTTGDPLDGAGPWTAGYRQVRTWKVTKGTLTLLTLS